MRILVTGHRGYIGPHLVQLLREAGHFVAGIDLRLFDGCHWDDLPEPDLDLTRDIRTLKADDLVGYDCVMHLAAISNDAMGELDPAITYSVNQKGTVKIAEVAKEAGVPRFLYASSCSVYGQEDTYALDETARLSPLSVYAESKIGAEQALAELADASFSPVFLRNATAYGYSPMLRTDLVVNNLLACAYTRGEIRIMSDGTPWRPLTHCRDIARAFAGFLTAPRDLVHCKAVNIGADQENYQVFEIADKIRKLIPNASIVYTGEIGTDPRNYRVSFRLLNRILPDFQCRYNLETGLEELYSQFKAHDFSLSDFEGPKFVRMRMLKDRIKNLEEMPC